MSIEKKFYNTFGIKPKRQCYYSDTHCKNHCNKDCVNFYMKPKYPDITAEKLLEMICILNETACEVLVAENVEDLKNEVLETCLKVYNTPILTSDGDEYDNYAIYDKIQKLFKEGE